MAKDVVTFLNWAAEPEHDERKQYGLKAVILLSVLTAISLYVKRFKWTVIKNRKLCEFSFSAAENVNKDSPSLQSTIPRWTKPIRLDSFLCIQSLNYDEIYKNNRGNIYT